MRPGHVLTFWLVWIIGWATLAASFDERFRGETTRPEMEPPAVSPDTDHDIEHPELPAPVNTPDKVSRKKVKIKPPSCKVITPAHVSILQLRRHPLSLVAELRALAKTITADKAKAKTVDSLEMKTNPSPKNKTEAATLRRTLQQSALVVGQQRRALFNETDEVVKSLSNVSYADLVYPCVELLMIEKAKIEKLIKQFAPKEKYEIPKHDIGAL